MFSKMSWHMSLTPVDLESQYEEEDNNEMKSTSFVLPLWSFHTLDILQHSSATPINGHMICLRINIFSHRQTERDMEAEKEKEVESIRGHWNIEALTVRYEMGIEGLEGINYTKIRTEIEGEGSRNRVTHEGWNQIQGREKENGKTDMKSEVPVWEGNRLQQ